MFVSVLFTFSYVLPMSLIIYYYSQIVSHVVNHEKALKQQAKKMNVDTLRSNQNQASTSVEIRIAKAAITVCFLFVASWTPYAVLALIGGKCALKINKNQSSKKYIFFHSSRRSKPLDTRNYNDTSLHLQNCSVSWSIRLRYLTSKVSNWAAEEIALVSDNWTQYRGGVSYYRDNYSRSGCILVNCIKIKRIWCLE